MNIKNIIGIIIIPFIALTVVTLLYILLPVSANLITFITDSTLVNISLLTTLFGIFYAIGLLIWGVLSDKLGKDNILIIGLLLLASVSLIIPMVTNYHLLLCLRAIQGFCAASFPPVAIAWISINLIDSYKSLAISILSCTFLLAGTLGQWFGTIMIIHSLYSAMVILAIIYILGAITFYYYRRTTPKAVQQREPTSLSKIAIQLPAILFNRKLSPIYLCALFVLLSFVVLYSVLAQSILSCHLTTLRNIGIVTMLLCLTASYIFRWLKPIYVLAIALFTMAISLTFHYLFITSQLTHLAILYMMHFIFIASLAYAIPAMITTVALGSKQQERGLATSLYTCILFIGASLGSLLPSLMNVNLLIIMVSIALIICASQLILIKPN